MGMCHLVQQQVAEFFPSAMQSLTDPVGGDRLPQLLAEVFGELGRSVARMIGAKTENGVKHLSGVLLELSQRVPGAA